MRLVSGALALLRFALTLVVIVTTGGTALAQTAELDRARKQWEQHFSAGEFRLALPYARRLLTDARTRYKVGSTQLPDAQYRAADLLHYLGELDEAQRLYTEALRNARAIVPLNQPLLAKILSAYGDPSGAMALAFADIGYALAVGDSDGGRIRRARREGTRSTGPPGDQTLARGEADRGATRIP
jgi:hypothetical protein